MEEKKFKEETFNEKEYNFIVAPDGNIYSELFPKPASRIILKPNLLAIYRDNGYFTFDNRERLTGKKRELIREYKMDEETFEYLHSKDIISISTEMAIFYGFNPNYGNDRVFKKNPFKHAKGKILSKQKKGIFN